MSAAVKLGLVTAAILGLVLLAFGAVEFIQWLRTSTIFTSTFTIEDAAKGVPSIQR